MLNREHWTQKSSILDELQLMKREFSISLATDGNPDHVAQRGIARLDVVLSRDLTSWLGLRKQKAAESQAQSVSTDAAAGSTFEL